jgi:glycine/D-amino acid oxidase-like deaminating enzyme
VNDPERRETMPFKKIAVLGAGAIGSTIGGYLTRAGHDVTLVDLWPAHGGEIRRGALLAFASRRGGRPAEGGESKLSRPDPA